MVVKAAPATMCQTGIPETPELPSRWVSASGQALLQPLVGGPVQHQSWKWIRTKEVLMIHGSRVPAGIEFFPTTSR